MGVLQDLCAKGANCSKSRLQASTQKQQVCDRRVSGANPKTGFKGAGGKKQRQHKQSIQGALEQATSPPTAPEVLSGPYVCSGLLSA